MPDGGQLEIEVRRLLRAHPGDPGRPRSWVVVSVRDSGSGMDADTCVRAIEPFFTTKEKGTGLGLASVRATVEDLGGFVELSSRVGQGTRVDLLLPLAEPTVEALTPPLDRSGP
ncbi:MAG: hybrid sensor histidine kinase/response regulator, partial [Myxococcales bacterium]|nr:hybrid sensor histidine kinase/response regulator [Myxococcales bacterium]